MSNRKFFILKSIAFFLVFNIFLELLFPVVAKAMITEGPSAPEVFAYQPSDATDNVSLATGDFNYTIPITSIPEYPMAIGYSSNAGMDQDATIFGFGINGFSGAIGRSMQGIPDDVSDGGRKYEYINQPNFTVAAEGTVAASVLPSTADLGINVGAEASLKVGYNNYKGLFGAIGIGIGIDAKLNQEGNPIKANLGISLNSDYGLSGGGSISIGRLLTANGNTNFKHESSFNARMPGIATYSSTTGKVKADLSETVKQVSHTLKQISEIGINYFPSSNTVSSYVAPLSSIVAPTNGFGASLTVPLPTVPAISITGSFDYQNYGNLNETKRSYGFMYLKNYNNRDYSHIADFTIEGENSFDNNSRNNPSVLQRDIFMVNSQGISGSMQLYQDQYGVVSRNYQRTNMRNANFIGLETQRKEVDRWTHVGKANINKQLDIIKILKNATSGNGKENDFDNTIFIEKELKSLTGDDRKFNNTAKFKMRGDMAGEFNLASSKFNDYAPNSYEIAHITGTGFDSRLFFLGEEKEMPHYYPAITDVTSKKYNGNNSIKTSTNITYYTIGQILAAHDGGSGEDNWGNVNPNLNNSTSHKFNESFLSHYNYNNSSSRQDTLSLKSSNIENLNILKHLKDNIRGSNTYVDNLIGDIRVKTSEGITYVYNLPAFNHVSKSLMLKGKGQLPPVTDNNEYHSFLKDNGNSKDRDKSEVTEEYKYPYAWMLTAIVGPDYIDFDDVPGPSEGDLGSWVKFKYVKVADNYRWRAPYTGMNHIAGAIHTSDDDMYMVSTGTKELYYISEIESGNYVSKFQYTKRFDGVDANGSGGNGAWNGDAHNSLNQSKPTPSEPTGNNFQFAVTRVELYKKYFDSDHSATRLIADRKGKLIRATEFKYDYSVCPNTANNLTTYKGIHSTYDIKVGKLKYHVDYSDTSKHNQSIGTGKLTLRKVQHISYEGSSPAYLPSYELAYGFDGKNYNNESGDSYVPHYNPSYDPNQVDQWGNYSRKASTKVNESDVIKNPATGTSPGDLNYYNSFTELDKTQADYNAQAYKLSEVLLPGGGSLNVDFEAKSYGKVQDKNPFVMRKVKALSYNNSTKQTTLTVDISDLASDSKSLDDILDVGSEVYGEISFYESNNSTFPKREDQTFIGADYAKVVSFGSTSTTDGRTYQQIVLKYANPSTESLNVPFVTVYKQYLFGESNKMKAIKENLSSGCDISAILHKYETLEKDGPLDAAKKIITNVRNYFKSDSDFADKFEDCFGDASDDIYPGESFLRTPVYKEKFTGSRVKTVSFSDNFRYATLNDGSAGERENVYKTNYFYDVAGSGSGLSEGVATVEPGGGKSCVIDIYQKTGAVFMPAPSIMYAKTTMETGYSLPTGSLDDEISRKKGKVEYHFYSPKDNDYLFDKNFSSSVRKQEPGMAKGKFFMFGIMTWLIFNIKIFKKKIPIKIPLPIPLTVKWNRSDGYHLQSHAYADQTDMYGRLKKVVQVSADGKEIARNEFKYFGKADSMAVYDGSNGGASVNPYANDPKYMKLGRMDQAWSEAYYTNEAGIRLIPWLLFLTANTDRNFAYTNMKYTYVPPVLKEVTAVNSIDGTITSSKYTAFDYYTGQALQVENKDSYTSTKIHRIVPAYWKYPEMGPPTTAKPNNQNLLTQATGNIVYLNTVSNSNVLTAGVTEWTKNNIVMNSTVRNTGKVFASNNTDFNYAYEVIGADTLEKIYNTNGKTRSSLSSTIKAKIDSNYFKSSKFLIKPYKTYTYDVSLNNNGTFNSFTPFDYSLTTQSDAKWKLLNTNTLFDMYGNVVETKDILDKYAAAYFGYNFSYSTSSVGNSSWKQAAYASAENNYLTSTSQRLLDDYRISLLDAEFVNDCDKTFTNKTIVYSSFTSTPAKVLNICVPSSPDVNKPFAKVNITYAHNSAVARSLFISFDDNRDIRIMSDQGEEFKGFYTLNGNVAAASCSTASYKLAFDPSVFTSFTLDNSFTDPAYLVTQANEVLPLCSMPNVNYKVPNNNCFGMAHTGSKAFALQGSKKGTRFDIDLSSLPSTEAGRKYKAMVWVTNSSPLQTSLIVENAGGTIIKSTSLATPYMKAGNWSLLRLDIDPSDYGATSKIVVYVKNNSSAGSSVYDDFRVLPYQASMENYVYDHKTGRVVAKLDNENIATFFIYDDKGRLKEVKAEIEKIGVQTIKKYQYNEQKKN